MTDQTHHQVGTHDKSVEWYNEQLENVSEATRELLEKYSKIPADRIISHCLKVRDTAWDIFPYPCVGQFRFLDLSIGVHPAYSEISSRMNSGSQTYLDLGCCFGQDIRRLVYDGAPSDRCYGSDLRLDFMELGYDLFLDRETLKTRFIPSDVFDPDADIKELDGQVDMLHAASFFHLFDLDQQKTVARRVVKLLKPQKDSLLVGRQVGNVKAGESPHGTTPRGNMYRHNIESWTKMWKEVGQETDTEWEVKAELTAWPGIPGGGGPGLQEGTRRLQFAVRRV